MVLNSDSRGSQKSLAPSLLGAFTFLAPRRKQDYLLPCRIRTVEPYRASKRGGELVPRQS